MINGWKELPLLGTDTMTLLLISSGTKAYRKDNLKLLFSPMEQHLDGYWKHASISHHHRYPTWDEILEIRYSFFDEKDDVCQILPPKAEYINMHEYCFHLWSPIGKRITAK